MAYANEKQPAHQLVEQLDAGQLAAVVRLQVMIDPVARSLANAPVEDEPISEGEARAVDAPRSGSRITNPFPMRTYSPSSA